MEKIKDLVFLTKNNCYLCREEEAEDYICHNCRENLELIDSKLEDSIEGLESVYVSLFYNRYVKKKIKDFKFYDKSYLYKPFAEIMIDTIRKNKLDDVDIIVPVPIYRDRWKERGYNQAELLSKYIGKSLGIEYRFDIIDKTRNTHPQSKLDIVERKVNLVGSFKGNNLDYIKDKKILLVDDVTSTGSTLKEVAKLLNTIDNKGVVGLILASTNV